MASSSDLFEDAPEDDDDFRIVVPTTTTTTTTISVANNNHFSNTSPHPPMMTQQDRRRKRRRLFRLLKNPDTVPSFLRVINAPHVSSSSNTNNENDTSTSSAKPPPPPPLAVDDDDFLLEPPVVVIDVDEYLGLKKKREEEEQQQQQLLQPDMARSGRIIPPPVVSSSSSSNNNKNNNNNNNLLNNPADEGWYEGHLTMAMPEDVLYLSELQQWIRRNMEYFSASPEDVHTNQAGRRTPTVRGKVGIRCLHCARAVEARRRQQAETGAATTTTTTTTKIHFPAGGVSYPMNFAGIYSTSIQKPQLHFEKCPYLPADSGLQALLERSRVGDEERKRMKEGVTALLYWTVSCHRLGMVETSNGVRFGRDLSLEPLPFESTKSKVEQEMPQLARGSQSHNNNAYYYSPARNSAGVTPDRVKSNNNPPPVAPLEPINLPKDAAEVLQEAIDEEDDPNERMGLRSDRHNLSSFMFLTLKQAAICHATAEDFAARGKKTKLMRMGLTGFCCRHCKDNYPTDVKNDGRDGTTAVMQASCRSFSSSSENLASAMSNSFVLHLLKCPYTPQRIQQALETLKKYHTQQMQQLPYGTQSRLFAEIWTRIRAMDKKFHTSEVPQPQPSWNTNQGTQEVDDDDEEFVPDSAPSFVSTKRGQERPRRGRQPVSDSVPVPGRGPNFPVPNDPETIEILKEVEENWDPDVNDGLILPEDRNLVSDYLFLCMRQLKVAIPMESDFRGNKRCNLIRLMAGMCCINCAELPDSLFIQPSGRTFPSAPDNMASAFNSSLYNHFLNCPGIPAKLKRVLPIVRKMHSQQCSSLVFGSQRRFFNRVFARLKEVPLHQPLSSSNNTETGYSETSLRDFSFIHRPYKGKDASGAEEYWQCMNCRMVPFEMRAKGSMFFTEPSTHELRAHFEVCAKVGVSWDRIKLSMQELEDTFGKETKLVDREQFAELIRLTVGNFDGLFDVTMAKLGKDVVTAEPLAGFFWRNLPTNFDFDAIKKAFQSLKVELISSGSNADCTGIMNLLTMLNCNFCPPTTEWEADVNVEKVKTQESVNPTDRIPAEDVEAVEDAVPQPSSDSVDASIATKSNSDSSNPPATKGASENEEMAASIPLPAFGKEQQEAMEQQLSVPVSSNQFDDLMD